MFILTQTFNANNVLMGIFSKDCTMLCNFGEWKAKNQKSELHSLMGVDE